MALKSFAEIKSKLDKEYSGNNNGSDTQERAITPPKIPTYQEILDILKKEDDEKKKMPGDSTNTATEIDAPIRSDIATPEIPDDFPIRSDASIAKSILGVPLSVAQQPQTVDLFQALTSPVLSNPYLMATANAGIAREQLARTEEEYDSFLQANQNSSTPPVNLPEALELQEKVKALDSTATYWENQKTAYKEQAVMQKDMEEFEKWSQEDQELMERYISGKNIMPLDFGSVFAFSKLKDKYGLDTLNRIAESYSRSRNQENTRKVAEQGKAHATGAVGKTLSSIASVGTNLMSNAAGAMDTLYAVSNDAITGTGRYSNLDPNLPGNLGGVYADAVRGKVSRDLENKGAAGKLGSVAYQGVMSAADSLARLAATGETGARSLAAMGTFSQTVSDVSAKGGNKYQALGMGIITAGLEAATEKVSLDNLLTRSKDGYQGAAQAIKDALLQAGVEASEEELSFIGSTLAEAAILREKSDYNQRIGELVAGGMSYQQAQDQVNRGFIDKALQTAAVSAASGSLMSGATSVVNKISAAQNNQTSEDIAPVRDDIAPISASNDDSSGDIAPVHEDAVDILPTAESSTGVNPESSVGAAEQGFTGKETYYDLLTDDNAQPDRTGDARPMEVPKTDAYDRRVSEFTANAYGAEVTPDAIASRIEELVADGALGFDTRTNKQSLEVAAADIQKRGMASTRNQITNAIASGKFRDGDIEKAMLLYTSYANSKSQAAQENAAEMMVDLATMANMTGRNLQLFKLLRKMTPDGQLMTVQKNVDRYVDQLNSRRSGKHQAEVIIPQEMMEQYRSAAEADLTEQTADTARAKDEIEQAIYKVTASQIKATPMEKLNAWRYMAMLGNAKTQVRNVLGNAAFKPYVATKRAVGAVMERMFVEQDNRTKSILGFGKDAGALKKWAAEDAKSADTEKLFSYSAQTGDAPRAEIEDNRAIFDTNALEAVRKFVQAVPEGADMIFKRSEYSVSLASFLKARGYTAEDLHSGLVAEDVLNEARSYASQEALKATFNDQNAVSDFVSRRYKGTNAFGKAMNLLAEGVLPFRRTPANILVRGVEYSPANIGRSMYNLATKVRSGEMSASTAIDQMAAGLTGTGAMVLGYAMASGIFGFKLVGHLDDEDEKNAGHQAYAIEIGGKSYTIDWAAPANIPLFVGANIHDALKDRDPDADWFVSVVDATVNSLEPMLELSCLSSLNDLLESVRYAESGTEVYTVVAQSATSYLNQYIPTLFGQIEQAAEEEKNQVYSDADTALERSIEKTIGRATQKIPGLDLFQAQKYDNWGRPVETSTLFGALVNPSYVSEISTDPVDAEILRLNEAQEENVSIDKPAQTITYTDKNGEVHKNQRLTAQQWETLQQVYGQTAKQILDGMIGSKDYEALSDSQKAEVFGLVYDYAREKSRTEAIEGYVGAGESWMNGIEGKEGAAIIQKVAASAFSDSFDKLTMDWRHGGDEADSLAELEEAYGVFQKLDSSTQEAIRADASGRVEDFLAAMDAGVALKIFSNLYGTYYFINASDEKAAQKATDWAYALQRAKERGEITQEQLKVLKSEMTISSGFTVETEKFDAMTEAGISAKNANWVEELISGLEETGKANITDADKWKAVSQAYFLSESERDTVMKLYMDDYDPTAANPDKTELKYDYARQEMELSAEEYVKAYRAHAENSKKADKLRAWRAMGFSEAEANELYLLFAASGKNKIDVVEWYENQ